MTSPWAPAGESVRERLRDDLRGTLQGYLFVRVGLRHHQLRGTLRKRVLGDLRRTLRDDHEDDAECAPFGRNRVHDARGACDLSAARHEVVCPREDDTDRAGQLAAGCALPEAGSNHSAVYAMTSFPAPARSTTVSDIRPKGASKSIVARPPLAYFSSVRTYRNAARADDAIEESCVPCPAPLAGCPQRVGPAGAVSRWDASRSSRRVP